MICWIIVLASFGVNAFGLLEPRSMSADDYRKLRDRRRSWRAFIARRGTPDLREKKVRTEVIGCILAAIEQSQTVLNGNDVR
jgi:hypothetical protein